MPDRLIRADILTSERMNAVSWPAEVFYRRLMSVADDFGRYDGRSSILRACLYALKLDKVSESDVGKWIRECEEAGLVRCYTVEQRPYIEILRFNQRMRAAKSRWPAPADTCGQMPADVRESPPITETESEAKSETNAETKGAGSPLPVVGEEIPLPNVLLTEAFKAKWSEWIDYRRQRRLPKLLPVSIKAQWAEMADWGHDTSIAAIDLAIRKGWQGLFEPKANGHAAPAKPFKPLMR